jgi:hypothetical protein
MRIQHNYYKAGNKHTTNYTANVRNITNTYAVLPTIALVTTRTQQDHMLQPNKSKQSPGTTNLHKMMMSHSKKKKSCILLGRLKGYCRKKLQKRNSQAKRSFSIQMTNFHFDFLLMALGVETVVLVEIAVQFGMVVHIAIGLVDIVLSALALQHT